MKQNLVIGLGVLAALSFPVAARAQIFTSFRPSSSVSRVSERAPERRPRAVPRRAVPRVLPQPAPELIPGTEKDAVKQGLPGAAQK